MDVGVVIGWCNIALMAVAGLIALARWRHLFWFPFYALTIPLLAVFGRLWWYNHTFYLFKDHIGNLLLLLAVAEAWRAETKGRQWWVFLVLPVVIVLMYYPMPLELRYQIPQEPVLIAIVLMIPKAMSTRSPAILGWGFYASFILLYDMTTLFIPSLNWPVLQFFYPVGFTAMNAVWYWSLLEPERIRMFELLNTIRLKAKLLSREPVGNSQVEINSSSNSNRLKVGNNNVFNFPAPANGHRGIEQLDELSLRKTLFNIDVRLEAIEEAVGTIAKLSLEKEKVFLSRSELAFYLGTTEEVVDKFVKHYKIKKIEYTSDKNDWAVFIADVNEALGYDNER